MVMKKIVFIFCLFNSLFIYSQIDTDIIDSVKGISEYEESQIKTSKKYSDEKFILIYEDIDVSIHSTKESIKIKAFKIYPDLKKETKITQVIIFNEDEKEVVKQNINTLEAKIDTQDFPLGTYQVYVKTDSGQVTKQFIKE